MVRDHPCRRGPGPPMGVDARRPVQAWAPQTFLGGALRPIRHARITPPGQAQPRPSHPGPTAAAMSSAAVPPQAPEAPLAAAGLSKDALLVAAAAAALTEAYGAGPSIWESAVGTAWGAGRWGCGPGEGMISGGPQHLGERGGHSVGGGQVGLRPWGRHDKRRAPASGRARWAGKWGCGPGEGMISGGPQHLGRGGGRASGAATLGEGQAASPSIWGALGAQHGPHVVERKEGGRGGWGGGVGRARRVALQQGRLDVRGPFGVQRHTAALQWCSLGQQCRALCIGPAAAERHRHP
jgi:hypothetical protein